MRPRPVFPLLRWGVLLLVNAVAYIATCANPLHALQDELDAAWRAYEPARIEYRGSVAARDAIREGQLGAVDAVNAARDSGQRQRLEDALRAAQAWGSNLNGAEATLTRRRDTFRRAGEELIEQLERLESELVTRLRSGNPQQAIVNSWQVSLQQTRADIVRIEAELREVEDAVSPVEILRVVQDPRTSPQDYLTLAELYEERVRTYEDLIADSEAKIRAEEGRRAIDDELRRQGRDSNPAGGRSPVGGFFSPTDLITGRIDDERAKLAIYIAARDGYRVEALRARAFAAGRVP